MVEAFISVLIGEDARAQADAWYVVCETGMARLLDEAGDDLICHSGGAAVDPSNGPKETTWRGRRSPTDLALTFGPDTHYGSTRYVAPSPTGPAVGTTTTLVASQGTSHLSLRCQAFGFPRAGEDGIARTLRDIVAEYASRFPVDFGNVASDNSASRTALECALKRHEPVARDEAHRVLRGYAHVTLVPASLSSVVIPRLETSPRLSWRVLPAGTLMIQAGDSLHEYENSAITELFECLAPALPSGVPRIRRPLTGVPPQLLLPRDAREVAPFYPDLNP